MCQAQQTTATRTGREEEVAWHASRTGADREEPLVSKAGWSDPQLYSYQGDVMGDVMGCVCAAEDRHFKWDRLSRRKTGEDSFAVYFLILSRDRGLPLVWLT